MSAAEFAGYFIVPVIICVLAVLCFFGCRDICISQRVNNNAVTVYDQYCDSYSPTTPSHARIGVNAMDQPFPQQLQHDTSFTNLEDSSTERGDTATHSVLNGTNFDTSQNNATIFSEENPIILSAVEPSAPDLYNILSSPSEPQLYNITTPSAPQMHNLPSQSHRLNVRVSRNSVDVDDLPPDYATVVIADGTQGNELTQYPRVI
ncbi:uncharacterized protein [Parasteatoda tepidariorum]|uniref:uncharacterized protein n=1 Tax=Parasteatoda tepidariorum TaxID=114398 RepID=UPI0039BD1ECD